MIEIKGEYTTAKVYTDEIEETARTQIVELVNQPFAEDSKIRIMPDVHGGAGCVIGTTMTIKDKVVPNLVGVDIGCGVLGVKLKYIDTVDYKKLDNIIRSHVPSGRNVRDKYHSYALATMLGVNSLKCVDNVNLERAFRSVGTLGGGNHFIELGEMEEHGHKYLLIHSGSRYLGHQVATYYQNKAIDNIFNNKIERNQLIEKLKSEGREQDIQSELAKLRPPLGNKQLAWLEGQDMDDYLHDMKIVQSYARINRLAIANTILSEMCWEKIFHIETVHNYIDTDDMILRKGAVEALDKKLLLIPINMKDGTMLAIGKGNTDWNYSAPHGAGRLMSRTEAFKTFDMDTFTKEMDSVWTTSVTEDTLDESPMAYKPMESILDNIMETVDIVDIIKPTYNFKASK